MRHNVNVARITSGSILIYGLSADQPKRSQAQVENEKNLRDITYNGYMSPKTRSKVRRFLDAWITSVEVERRRTSKGRYFRNSRLSFITLTLASSQVHEDNYIKRHMLGRFMVRMQRVYKVRNYFWRAESQQNGNIHFHVMVDRYIHWKLVRQEWNDIQSDYGYIDRFEASYNHRDPNSTDIHGLEKVDDATAYVVKYCCKTEGYRPIRGRIWGCSDSLRELVGFEQDCSPQVKTYIDKVQRDKASKTVVMDEYTLIFCDNNKMLQKYEPELHKKWCRYYEEIYKDLYIREIVPKEKTKIPQEPIYTVPKEKHKLAVQLELFSSGKSVFCRDR